MDKQWFVVRTKAFSEHIAAVAIAAEGFDIFLPVVKVRVSHARKVSMESRPLFSRYVFTAFEPDPDVCDYGRINRCRGVVKRGLIVAPGGRPVRVPDAIIQGIRDREALALARAGEITTGYEPGETFEIVRGHAPITVTYMGEERGKVWVLIPMFGIDHELSIEFDEVPPKKLLDIRAA